MENLENIEFEDLFTEMEINELGLTQKDIDIFNDAESLADTIELLPEDSDKVMKNIDKYVEEKDSFDESVASYLNLAETNPQVFKELFGLYELVNSVKEVEPAQTQKLSAADIQKEEENEIWNNIVNLINQNVGANA